jgi:hypothetical protein
MEKKERTNFYNSQLVENGYVHVPFSRDNDLEVILNELGKIIQVTEIKESEKSSRFLLSNRFINFHTDHYKAKFIVWFCNSQSSIGGESLLIDSSKIIERFNQIELKLLSEIFVDNHIVFYGDEPKVPIIQFNDIEVINSIFYADWLIDKQLGLQHKSILEKFQNQIDSVKQTKILLSEGDILIINNNRMLHGRNSFPKNSNRWLTRYWIS